MRSDLIFKAENNATFIATQLAFVVDINADPKQKTLTSWPSVRNVLCHQGTSRVLECAPPPQPILKTDTGA